MLWSMPYCICPNLRLTHNKTILKGARTLSSRVHSFAFNTIKHVSLLYKKFRCEKTVALNFKTLHCRFRAHGTLEPSLGLYCNWCRVFVYEHSECRHGYALTVTPFQLRSSIGKLSPSSYMASSRGIRQLSAL